MTYLRYGLLALFLAVAVIVALANSTMVTLALLPGTLAAFVGTNYTIRLPLFVIVGGAIGLGLVLGLIWEWLREWSIRRQAVRTQRELDAVKRGERASPVPAVKRQRDEILQIVDEQNTAR